MAIGFGLIQLQLAFACNHKKSKTVDRKCTLSASLSPSLSSDSNVEIQILWTFLDLSVFQIFSWVKYRPRSIVIIQSENNFKPF